MKADDIPACVRVLMENDLWRLYGITEHGAEQMLKKALSESEDILVAKINEKTAGFAWWMAHGVFGRSAYLRLIGVLPEFQRMGIGKVLMHTVENMAARRTSDIFLLATDSNQSAQRFYQREGYQQIGAIPDYVINGITELIFYKKLVSLKEQPAA